MKVYLPKKNMRYRGPVESKKLKDVSLILTKTLTDIKKDSLILKKQASEMSIKRTTVINTMTNN